MEKVNREQKIKLGSDLYLYYGAIYLILTSFFVFLFRKHSLAFFSFLDLTLIIPIMLFWLISFVFKKSITLGEKQFVIKTWLSSKSISYQEVDSIKYKPGGFINGITIAPRILIKTDRKQYTIPLNRDTGSLEQILSERLKEWNNIDLPAEKKMVINDSTFVFFPLETIFESLMHLAFLFLSICYTVWVLQ